MPFHREEAVFLAAICIGSLPVARPLQEPVLQRFRQDSHQIEFRADGFLDGSNIQRLQGRAMDNHEKTLQWMEIPECARDLFGKHKPNPPNQHGMRELLPGLDGFYIIHDSSHTKRRARLEKALHNSRLGELATWVTWFSEEDLSHLHHTDMACVFNKSYAEPLFVQSVSAPLSRNLKHLWVYHDMLRRRLRSVLVMEDNPVFRGRVDDITEVMRELKRNLPQQYGVVMLGDTDIAQGHPWRAQEVEQSFRANHAAQKVSEHLYRGGLGHRGASGYLIAGASAAKILRYVFRKFKTDAETDKFMENALGIDGFYWYDPPLWVQSESPAMVELGRSDEQELQKPQQEERHQDQIQIDPKWALYHRDLGTDGDDDPYRGALERHRDD